MEKEIKKLNEEVGSIFRHLVSKLLRPSKRERKNIQTDVYFMCKRVREPDIYDLKKLQRTIKYLEATRWFPIKMDADGIMIIKWWIDVSYGVHKDFQGHTGGTIILGTRQPSSTPQKQKLNTRSSTESELVGIENIMPMVLWNNLFMAAQGYEVKGNIVYQDNRIAIMLANSGKDSIRKRTKHINIRYFFVTYRLAKKDTSMEYLPTADMYRDFHTDPTQGGLYNTQYQEIINLQSNDPNDYIP